MPMSPTADGCLASAAPRLMISSTMNVLNRAIEWGHGGALMSDDAATIARREGAAQA